MFPCVLDIQKGLYFVLALQRWWMCVIYCSSLTVPRSCFHIGQMWSAATLYMLPAKQSVWTWVCLWLKDCVLEVIWYELRGLVGIIHTPACLHENTQTHPDSHTHSHCALKLMWSNELLCRKSCTLLWNDPSITFHYRRRKRDSGKFISSFIQLSVMVV